jgi:hypothetical protein
LTVPADAAAPDMRRLGRGALAVGIGGAVLCAIGWGVSPGQFFRSYLVAYLFWLGIALGCLGILMLQHLTGGAWGIVIRRLLESGARTLPLLALLFVPILFGLQELFVWARPEAVAADEILQHKSLYLNVPFFIVRAVVYFAAWTGLAWLLCRWSARQDATGDPRLIRKLGTLSGPGIVIYVLTMTFASVDWVMSLEPHWFSTIFGGLLVAGQALAAMAFVIAALSLLAGRKPLAGVIGSAHFHDLGKLLLAFVMVWSYFAFSQFLIIWAGNLPEEIPWYLSRLTGGWEWLGLALVIAQFAAPFLLLLSRDFKRNANRLARVAALVVLLRLLDMYWMIAPAFDPGAFAIHWLDIVAPLGLGGIWLAVFVWQLGRMPLLPLRDEYLPEAIGHGHE